MNRKDINQLLNDLNKRLVKMGESRELVVCGGAALILSNFNKEETVDIDLISPSKDELLQKLSSEIANDLDGLRPNWLNSHAATFFREHNPLPAGWKDRLVTTLKKTNLIVKTLSNEDLLFTKICAHIDREEDEDDIKELSKSAKMFEMVVERVQKISKFQGEDSLIIIEELRTRLGFND